MARVQLVGIEAEPAAVGDGEVLEQQVGALEELVEAHAGGAIGEIDGHAPFVGVAEQKRQRSVRRCLVACERSAEPARLSARRLDLENVGAEVAEHATRERAAEVAQIEDAQVSEGAWHRLSYLRNRRAAS